MWQTWLVCERNLTKQWRKHAIAGGPAICQATRHEEVVKTTTDLCNGKGNSLRKFTSWRTASSKWVSSYSAIYVQDNYIVQARKLYTSLLFLSSVKTIKRKCKRVRNDSMLTTLKITLKCCCQWMIALRKRAPCDYCSCWGDLLSGMRTCQKMSFAPVYFHSMKNLLKSLLSLWKRYFQFYSRNLL